MSEPEYTNEDLQAAVSDARSEGYDEGYSEGYESGCDEGRESGYSDGFDDGCVSGCDSALDNIDYTIERFFTNFDPDLYLNEAKSALDTTLLRDALIDYVRTNA